MSLVYITHHNENVWEFAEKPEPEKRIPLKYTSVFSKEVKKQMHQPYVTLAPDGTKLLTDSGKHQRRTMGCAQIEVNPPEYLRKNQGSKWRRLHEHVCPKYESSTIMKKDELPPRPPCKGYYVPTQSKGSINIYKNDKKSLSSKSDETHVNKDRIVCKYVNFVARNIQKAKESKKKIKTPHYIDKPTGDRHRVFNSGLVPQYVCKESFAKVPNYIEKHKRFLKKYNELCKTDQLAVDKCSEIMKEQEINKMSVEERFKITEGLRVNLEAKMKSFLGFSFCIDTDIRKMRQAKMEADIKQLERDIAFMESNPVIYVAKY